MDPKLLQRWRLLVGLLGATAVGLGAVGAHALEPWLKQQPDLSPEAALRRLDNFKLAANYQLWHAVALLASLALPMRGMLFRWCWVLGIMLFSGCLYGYALQGGKFWVQLVPLGGVSFIIGWLALAFTAVNPPGSIADSQHQKSRSSIL